METQCRNPPPQKSTRVENQIINIEDIYFVLGSLGDNFLMVNKSLLNTLNDLVAANYLSFLLERFKFHLKEESLEDGWFYLKQEKVIQELKISRRTIRRAKTKLKDFGIIDTKMKGLPQKEYFLIDISIVKNLLIEGSTIGLKTEGPFGPKRAELSGRNGRNYRAVSAPLYKDNNLNKKTYNKDISYVSSKQTEEDHPSNSNFNGKILRNKKPSNKQKKVVSFKTISKDQFELFYKRYPRKINKGKAKNAWNKLCNKPLKERPTLQDLLKAVSKQSKTSRWQEIKFIPHPATWLNQSRWMDEVEPMNEIYPDYNKRNKPNNGFQTDGSVFRRVTKNAHISN